MSVSEEDFKQALGRRVQELRSLKNFGVREFALIADIEHHQLINIEKGRVDIRLSTLRKISKALEMQPSELLKFD